jgi:serine/threonine-protein kinase
VDPARWEQLQVIFHRVVDLRPEERRAALDATCANDDDLRMELERLLEEDARPSTFLDRDIRDLAEDVLGEPSAQPPSSAFGRYRIIEKIGEGGMGIVYLAERTDVGQRVAIKVLRDAWVSPERRERFAGEQRALARLGHRAIARLYDVDTLEDGTPYFVM